jgi:hypothetical protein
MMKKSLLLFSLLLLSIACVYAQPVNNSAKKRNKNYTSVGIEGSLIQFARMNTSEKIVPRYTYFFNVGVDYNRRLDNTVSVFTGIHMKNVGLIHVERVSPNSGTQAPFDIKTKERVYTLGAPIGVRVYSRNHKTEFKVGMDCGLALNYKYKQFIGKNKIDKFNEWFSPEASVLHYSVFAGINVRGASLTANYYLNNFYGRQSNLVANLFTLGVGIQLDQDDVSVNGNKLGDKN